MADLDTGTLDIGDIDITADRPIAVEAVRPAAKRRHVVTLAVAGEITRSWTSVEITRTIEAVSGGFELKLASSWADVESGKTVPKSTRVRAGDGCAVAIDEEIVVTGWIDEVTSSYESRGHVLTIKGRDRTADLADCSAYPFAEVAGTGAAFAPILAKLVAPYKVAVRTEASITGLVDIKVNPGETILDYIERHGRMLGVMAVSDGQGTLLLTRAGMGGTHAPLAFPGDFKSATIVDSMRERYSDYYVVGQAQGGDDWTPLVSASVVARAQDPGVGRHRLLVVQAEHSEIGGLGRRRAEWERTVRIGKGWRANYVVQGWYDYKGKLWGINRTLSLLDPWSGYETAGEVLVAGVKFTQTVEQGSTTMLTLTRKEAYSVEPAVANPHGQGWY